MSVPGIVESALDGEEIAARVSLGGDDELYVTPTRTLIYRAEGLLSDESIEEYGHDADRLAISEGRRKTRFSLDYPLDGTQEFTLPAKHAEDAIHPILAGMLNASGVTDAGETVLHTYRFSELTLVITSDRVVKHIGEAVWDDEYEEYPFADLTGFSFEEGDHATQFVLEVDGRPERIKTPSDEGPRVREHLKQALFEFYDVTSMSDLTETIEPEDADQERDEDDANVDFGEGVDPLEANPPSAQNSSTESLTDERFDRTAESESAESGEGNGASEPADSGVAAEPTGTHSEAPGTATESADAGADEQRASTGGSAGEDRAGEADGRTGTTGSDQGASAGGEQRDGGGAAPNAGATADASGQGDHPVAEPEPSPERADGAAATEESTEDVQRELEAAGFEPAEGGTSDVAAELEELREAIAKQNKLLARQQQTIEQLIEELRRGR